LFKEFAVTLSVAVLISLVISLTTTPMMCAWLLKPGGEHEKPPGRVARVAERGYAWVLRRYEHSLDWALASKALVMLILLSVIARLRPQLARVTGLQVFLNPVQDVRSGGRSSNSTYQYTLKSDNVADLKKWATKLADEMKQQPQLTDVDTDQQENGVQTTVK